MERNCDRSASSSKSANSTPAALRSAILCSSIFHLVPTINAVGRWRPGRVAAFAGNLIPPSFLWFADSEVQLSLRRQGSSIFSPADSTIDVREWFSHEWAGPATSESGGSVYTDKARGRWTEFETSVSSRGRSEEFGSTDDKIRSQPMVEMRFPVGFAKQIVRSY